jgi:hypothetical protein
VVNQRQTSSSTGMITPPTSPRKTSPVAITIDSTSVTATIASVA